MSAFGRFRAGSIVPFPTFSVDIVVRSAAVQSRLVRWRMSRSWTRTLRFILSLSRPAVARGSRRMRRVERRARTATTPPRAVETRSSRSSPTPCRRSASTRSSRCSRRRTPGKGVTFSQSYGASGDQSRKVEAGLPTDVVNFSVEPDVTRLVDAGLVDEDWNANEHKGIPFGSVVTIVTRKGNPEGHQDLGRPAQARHRGRHAEPVQLGLGEVEPAGALRREEQRRQGPAGRPRLPRAS